MAAVQEKDSAQSVEPQSPPEHLEHGDSSFVESFKPREKALIRKIDWRLLPILGALYAVALVDRINVRSFPLHLPQLSIFSNLGRSPPRGLPGWVRNWNWKLAPDIPLLFSSFLSHILSLRYSPSLPCPHWHIRIETSMVTLSDSASVEYRPTSGRECQLARLYCIFLGSSNAWNGTG